MDLRKCKVKVLAAQLCLTLCDPMDCSLPGSSVHGILQARILEWVAIYFPRESSPFRDWTQVSCTAGRFCTFCLPRKPWIWELDHNEGWTLKNWYFRLVMLEKTLERALECKDVKPVNPKEDQPWIFIGRTVAETETPLLWPSDVKSQFLGEDPNAGNDWRQKEKGAAEGEMVRQQRGLNGRESISCSNSTFKWNLSKLWEMMEDRGAWFATVHGVESQTQLSNWITTAMLY